MFSPPSNLNEIAWLSVRLQFPVRQVETEQSAKVASSDVEYPWTLFTSCSDDIGYVTLLWGSPTRPRCRLGQGASLQSRKD